MRVPKVSERVFHDLISLYDNLNNILELAKSLPSEDKIAIFVQLDEKISTLASMISNLVDSYIEKQDDHSIKMYVYGLNKINSVLLNLSKFLFDQS